MRRLKNEENVAGQRLPSWCGSAIRSLAMSGIALRNTLIAWRKKQSELGSEVDLAECVDT